MRNLKYYLFFVLFFCVNLLSKAQHVGEVNQFEILPEYLINGKIKLSDGPETVIKYKVTFARAMATTVPTLTWKPFNMKIRLSAGDKNNNIVLFDPSYTITGADFGAKDAFLKDKIYTGTIINSKLHQGNPIILAYTTDNKDIPIGAFQGKAYSFDLPVVVKPPVVTLPVKADSIPVWRKIRTIGTGSSMLSTNPAPSVPYDGLETRSKMFYAFNVGVAKTVPIYQLLIDRLDDNPRSDYVYSQDFDFGDHVHQARIDGSIIPNWKNKDIAFYAFAQQMPGTIPIYGFISGSGKSHYYSPNINPDYDYKLLGIEFYAYPAPADGGRSGRGTPGTEGDSGTPSRPQRDGGTTDPNQPTRGGTGTGDGGTGTGGGRSGRG